MTDLTVILTAWKRPYLDRQLAALAAQTIRPAAIWVYHCGRHVDPTPTLRKLRGMSLNYIHSDDDLGYFGRFAIAAFVPTRYVTIVDDDLMPGREWLALALDKVRRHRAVISTAGVLLLARSHDHLVARYVGGDGTSTGDVAVDFGCTSWMFETEWARRFWTLPPAHLDNAEDMHFGATMAQHGIRTIVPAQESPDRSGNAAPRLGHDQQASWRRDGYDEQRNATLAYLLASGWRPLRYRRTA